MDPPKSRVRWMDHRTNSMGWTPGRVRLPAEPAFCAFVNTLCGRSHGDQYKTASPHAVNPLMTNVFLYSSWTWSYHSVRYGVEVHGHAGDGESSFGHVVELPRPVDHGSAEEPGVADVALEGAW